MVIDNHWNHQCDRDRDCPSNSLHSIRTDSSQSSSDGRSRTSIGIVFDEPKYSDSESMLRDADFTMYQAK